MAFPREAGPRRRDREPQTAPSPLPALIDPLTRYLVVGVEVWGGSKGRKARTGAQINAAGTSLEFASLRAVQLAVPPQLLYYSI
jgi:hypothetical protein